MARRIRARRFQVDAAYLIGMLVVILAFLAPAWRRPDSIWVTPNATYSDLMNNDWSSWWLVTQTLREHGQVPLWRPSIMGGVPLVGNPLIALLYPPRWLLLVMPLAPAFHVQLALHMYGAACALYGLARWAAGRSRFAAFIGGLGYALTPKVVAEVGAGHVGLWQAYAWLPAGIWLLHSATQEQIAPQRARRRALGCGMVMAMAYLADPRIALLGALATAGYAGYRLYGVWRRCGRRAALNRARALALVPLSAAALGAIQALPTLEMMRSLTRATLSLQEAGFLSLPWRYLIGYLLSDWGGYHEWMTYLGLLPLGLALLALWQSRARVRWFWLGLAVLALVYALGLNTPLYPLLYRALPALGWVRVPPRALLLVALAGNVLAAYGTDALLATGKQGTAGDSPRARRLAALFSFGALLAFVGLGLGFAWIFSGVLPPAVVVLTGIGAAGSLAWCLSLQPRVPRLLVQGLLAATLIADLGAVGHSLLELRPIAVTMNEGLATATWVAAQQPPFKGPYRVYSPSLSIPQHTGARLGLEQVDGIDPSQLRWMAHYVGLASGCPSTGYSVTLPYMGHDAGPSTACREAIPNARMLGLLNACYVVAEYPLQAEGLVLERQMPGRYFYQNEHCLPRAFVMTRAEPVSNWQEAQARLANGHDPAQNALVESGQALAGPPGWQPATIHERSPNRLTVGAETRHPALLVLSEVWYPGWQVTVDGIEQPIVRVNGLLRGVYLDPGAHTVVWRYRPASLRWGAALTFCALVGWLLVTPLTALAARRRQGAAP